jgi:TctA family transporter
VVLASGSLLKAIGMIVLGLLMGLVGTDVNSGRRALLVRHPELTDGIGFIVDRHGRVRLRRNHLQPRHARERARGVHRQGRPACSRPRKTSSA